MIYCYFRVMGLISALIPLARFLFDMPLTQHPPSAGDLGGVMFFGLLVISCSIQFFSGVSMGISGS